MRWRNCSAEHHLPPASPTATVGRGKQGTSSGMPLSTTVHSVSTRQAALSLSGSLPWVIAHLRPPAPPASRAAVASEYSRRSDRLASDATMREQTAVPACARLQVIVQRRILAKGPPNLGHMNQARFVRDVRKSSVLNFWVFPNHGG